MKIIRSDFSKNVLTVLSGSSLALGIAILLSPLLSRFFTPEQFGYLALYASLAAIASVVASCRFELTIVMAPTDRYAYYLLLVAFGLTIGFSVVFIAASGAVSIFYPELITGHLPLFVFFPMLTLGIFLTTANQILTSWGTRRKKYKGISQARVIQALTLCSGQVGLGAFSLTGFGLVIGHAFGAACMMLKLLKEYANEFRAFWRTASFKRVAAVAKRYKDFPRFMIVGQLANVISGQAPILLLAFLYDSHAAGLYSLAERVLLMPCAFIAASIGEVYRQEAASSFNRDGNCRSIFLKTAKKLALLGAVPAVVAIIASPMMFPIVFGEAWVEAGRIAAVLGFLVFFQTVVSPLSYTVLLTKMYRIDLIWQVTRLIVVAGGIYAGFYYFNSLLYSIVFLVAGFCVMYALHFILQYKAACGGRFAAAR
ncbi:colanic acid exporter [compost metagenome]